MLIKPIEPALAITHFYAVIVITAFITSVNIYLADGDSVFTFTHYFGLLLLVSGALFFGMAVSSPQILSSFAVLSGQMSTLVPGG